MKCTCPTAKDDDTHNHAYYCALSYRGRVDEWIAEAMEPYRQTRRAMPLELKRAIAKMRAQM